MQDSARSVYTGLIRIRPHARGTAAFQTNRNLTLSEGAWAESVPNLEIETNDVKCSHESTVGPIDQEQRFYLESRGIPTRWPSASSCSASSTRSSISSRSDRSPGSCGAKVSAKLALDRSLQAWLMASATFPLDELEPGTARRVEVDGVAVAVVRIDNEVYAIGDVCSHAKVSLSEGEVWTDERELECPKHGSTFDFGPVSRSPFPPPSPCLSTPSRWSTARSRSRWRRLGRDDHARDPQPGAAVGGKEILRGIDLTVSSGEVHAVMGPTAPARPPCPPS